MPLDPSLDPLFEGAGKQYNVDPNMLRAIALQESGGNVATPDSSAGAQGLMQIMPDTAKGVGVTDPRDPTQAIPGAAKLLSQRMSEAEALRANGQDVDPASYAVMAYFGGNPGPSWGPKTFQYGQDVAAKYRGLAPPTAAATPSPASAALPPDLAQLRDAGGSASILAPDQYAQSPSQFANQMARDVGASGGAPGGGGAPAAPATAQTDGLVRLASAGVSDVGPSSAPPTNAPQSTPVAAGGPVPAPGQSPAQSPSSQPAASSAAEDSAEGGLDPRLRAFGYGNLNLLPEPTATPAPSATPAAPATTPGAPPGAPSGGQPAPSSAEGAQAAQILAGYKDQAGLWALAGDEGQRGYYQHLYDTGISTGMVTGPQGQVLRVPGIFEAQAAQKGAATGAEATAEDPHTPVDVTVTDSTGKRYQTKVMRSWLMQQPPGGEPTGPAPTAAPTAPTVAPTAPTVAPTAPTVAPTAAPTPGPAPPAGPPPPAAGIRLSGEPVQPLGYQAAAVRVSNLNDAATKAQAQLGTISEMRDLLDNGLKTGWLAPQREEFANKLVALGLNPNAIKALSGINPADAGAFDKLALQLTGQAVQQQGSNQAASVFGQFAHTYPSLESNRQTLDLMTNSLGMLAKREQDRRDYVQNAWSAGGNTYDAELGAESAFDRQNPTTHYTAAAQLMSPQFANQAWKNVTDPAERKAMVALTRGKMFYDEQGNGRRLPVSGAPAPGF